MESVGAQRRVPPFLEEVRDGLLAMRSRHDSAS